MNRLSFFDSMNREFDKTCHFVNSFFGIWLIWRIVNLQIFIAPQFQVLVKFGMMHLIAGNVCIVIRTLVKETVKEIGMVKLLPNDTATSLSEDTKCSYTSIISNTVKQSSGYLFPFIIEYSIICAAVLFNMWSHIGKGTTYIVEEDKWKAYTLLISQSHTIVWKNYFQTLEWNNCPEAIWLEQFQFRFFRWSFVLSWNDYHFGALFCLCQARKLKVWYSN